MKIKYIALCLLLALVSCQRDEEMEIGQVSIGNEHLEASYSSVEISCSFQANVTIKNVQAYLSTEADFSSAKSYSLSEKEKNTFGATIEGLKDASTYYVRYEVSNRWSSKMIDEVSEFKTIPCTIPAVQTSEVSEVTHSTAIVGGVITEHGGQEITERGVVYSKSPNPSIENGTKVESLEKAESYACTLMDLEYVTTYYVRAYAINEKGVAYGEERSLTTLSTSATMGDISVIEIGGTTATIQAELLTDGGASIEKLGICCNMSGEPTINDSIVLSSENKIGIFQCTIDNLSGATTYYVRAFATNANGTVYSEQISFKTEATIATVTTTQATIVSHTSATVGGNVTNDGGASVTERGICYSTSANPTTANTKIISGSGLGQFTCNLTDLQDGTTYYVRAYAINEKGTAYGEEVSFTTKQLFTPTIVTTQPTNVAYNSATVGGNVTSDGGAEVTERGIVYATTQNPTTADSKVSNGSGLGEFTCNLTDLQDGTIYYVRAYAVNEKGIAYGNEVSFTTIAKTVATITTKSATNVSYTSATVGGNVTNDGGLEVTERGVVYSTNQNPTTANNKVTSGSGLGQFTCNLTDLQDGTIYYVRAYAVNEKGIAYGNEVSFTTIAKTVATITTKSATNVSYTSATVGGNVTDDGGAEVTERGICYSTSANPTTSNTKIICGSGLGQFTCNLTDLQDGTIYYVRAYAVNEKGIAYGNEVSFTTIAKTVATITTKSATNVSYTSATVGGNVTNDGGLEVTERGVVYSTNQNPTTANNKVTSGSGLGQFTCNLTDLQDGTIYYVRAYAVNEKGIAYGNEVSFTTIAKTVATITTKSATNVSYTSATVGGNVTDDGGAEVTERGICYSTSANPTTSNTKIICGSGLGQFTCNLTDLQDGTTYYVRAYAINAKGTSYGEEVSFTTKERYYENGYEYIDLGLSVKWATMNVGANSPEEHGDYFAWGETEPKATYYWSTYKWCNGSYNTQTKYNTNSSYGTVDNKTQLELSDDAARANWGGSWRMPTDAELTELREQCTWTWTTQNGVNGYKVTSKSNGNSIFLPAAGYRVGSSLSGAGSGGYCWSSSLSTDNPYYARVLSFYSDNVGRNGYTRDCGQSVRPVCP